MGFWICLGLTGLVLVLDLLFLPSEVLSWRNARRQRYSLSRLQFATGIESRAELEAIVGPPEADWLYHVPPETWARLPREAWYWKLSEWPVAPSMLLCATCFVLTLVHDQAHWPTFAAGLSLFALSVAVAILHVARREFEFYEDSLLPDYWDDDESDRMGLVASCKQLTSNLDQELAILEQNQQRYAEHGDMTWIERLISRAGDRYLERKLRASKLQLAHALEQGEAMERDLWVNREAARRCLETTDDPEWAAQLCEMELKANEGLDAVLGSERKPEDDPFYVDPDDPYGVKKDYDPDDPLS